jgi:hypothetical protein
MLVRREWWIWIGSGSVEKEKFQLEALATTTMTILKKLLAERRWRRNGLGIAIY